MGHIHPHFWEFHKTGLQHRGKHFPKAKLTRKQHRALWGLSCPSRCRQTSWLRDVFVCAVHFLVCLHIWDSTRKCGNHSQVTGHPSRSHPKETWFCHQAYGHSLCPNHPGSGTIILSKPLKRAKWKAEYNLFQEPTQEEG